MATTRAEVRKDRRVTTRRDYGYSKDENIHPKISPKPNVRSNAKVLKDENSNKGHSKFAVPPKKHVNSDLNHVNTKKTNPTIPSQELESERSSKPKKLEATPKNSDQESKRVSVSKLKNIFDSLAPFEANNEGHSTSKPQLKPRPKSAGRIPKEEPESGPTINRWSVPTYVNKASSQCSQNYKIYVTEGIAAKRARFEDSSSENLPVSVSLKTSSPKLSDLVPELLYPYDDSARSRTRSDPGKKPFQRRMTYKQRSYSDVGLTQDEMFLNDRRRSFDDTVIGRPRSINRLSKSNSVDVLDVSDYSVSSHNKKTIKEEPQIQSQDASSLECAAPQTIDHYNDNLENIKEDSPGDFSGKERIDSGISSVESSVENGEELSKIDEELHSTEMKTLINRKEEKHDHVNKYQKGERPRDESLIYGRPSEVREATWKDEEAPAEEQEEDTTPVYVAPEVNKEKSDTEVDRDLAVNVPKTDDTNHIAEVVSDEESSGSVVQHSSPEADYNGIPSEPFVFPNVPLSSAFAKKEKSKTGRNVNFARDEPIQWYTYSAEEYLRGNEEVDPVTASAEWELEKRVEKMDVFSVDLGKDERGLGLSIIGLGVGTDTGVEKLGIFIKSLTEGGAAEKDGRIQVNDQIIEVDGVSLVGVTQIFAAQTLKNTSGTVRFLMGREKGKHLANKVVTSPNNAQANKELEDLKAQLTKTEIRADRTAAKLRQMESKLETWKSSNVNESGDSKNKKLEESLAEMSEKTKNSETDLAISEAENEDMLKQLEESKGMYLLLEKRYNSLKGKNKEYEERIERETKASQSKNDSLVVALQNRVRELEQEIKQLKSTDSKGGFTSTTSSFPARHSPLTNSNATTNKPQERYFSLEAEKFERMAAAKTEEMEIDLDIIPTTEQLNSDVNLDKKRVAEAQHKSHKPTRASWGCSLDDIDMFKNGEGNYTDEEEEEEEDETVERKQEVQRPQHFGQGFALPGFPASGFKLKPTGRSLMDTSPSDSTSSQQQELRSSYPLAFKDKTQNVVVENLLEKQLSKTNHNKIASLPSAIDQEEGRVQRRDHNSDECLSGSTNSLEEIEEAARRIDSDLASSQASSRGSSPFLPPAMPLLKMKTVPVSDTYNEAAVDVPPDMSTESDSDTNVLSPGELSSFSPTSDSPSFGSGSSRLSNAWLSRPVQDWDVQQVGMWLTVLELEEYVIEFSNREIDGKELLNLDTSKMKSMAINQNSRTLLKKRIKELKAQTEREGKGKKQKDQKSGKKEGSPTPFQDTFEKLGFIKKGKYTVNQ